MSYGKRREADTRTDVGTPADANVDLRALRGGIGKALRMEHSGVLREEVPDRIAELVKELDQHQADPA